MAFWRRRIDVDMGSTVGVTVDLDHSAYTEHQVSPIALHLTGEHNIPVPVFQDDGSGIARVLTCNQ